MGSLYASKVAKGAEAWIGYHEDGDNWTIFAKILDDCGYFYPQYKQNQPWCATFCDCICLLEAEPKDRDDDAKKYDAQYFLYQPSVNNYSCGAYEFAGYFKDAGAFYTSDPKVGDMCFFNVNGRIGHVGIVVDVEDYITTVEGNAGDQVQKKWYSYSEIGDKIAGFGRPRYDEEPDEDTDDNNEPEPTPIPNPEPVFTQYTVSVSDFLNIRTSSDTSSDDNKIGELYDGATVYVFEEKDGWGRIGENMWVCMKYLV